MTVHPVVLYNVQRLLAVGGSPIARSLDATAATGWTAAAYRAKCARVGAVLTAATGGRVPAVLVLIEVEDASVVQDVLAAAGWPQMSVVDPIAEQVSGWDVAIAYDPAVFGAGVMHAESHVFSNRFDTRDALLARLATASGQELAVLATHWPSRRVSGSGAERQAAAAYCDGLVEQVLKFRKQDLLTPAGQPRLPDRAELTRRWSTPLLVAGDFNDEPWDESVSSVARAGPVRRVVVEPPAMPMGSTLRSVVSYLTRTPKLYNPCWGLDHNQTYPGTYYYDSSWHRLDQMLFSSGMLTGTPAYVEGSLRVFGVRRVTVAGAAVEVTTPAGYPIPFDAKTLKGVSDHLPVIAEIDV